jgi:hypothetical protein
VIAPGIERVDGGDHVVVEADQVLSGIGLISNAGARFEAPETISARGRFEDVLRGEYDPEQHLKEMVLDGVAGEVLCPLQGLFYFKVANTALMSAILRAYNDWLAEFCRTDPARLKGIAMINLDDVEDGIKELERAARLDLAGAMITEYRLEHWRYDGSEYEPFWAVTAALDPAAEPAHGDAPAGQDPRGRGQDIARRQQSRDKGVLSGAVAARSDLLRRLRASPPPSDRRVRASDENQTEDSGPNGRNLRSTVDPVGSIRLISSTSLCARLLSTMDYTYRERHGEAIYRFKSLPLRKRGRACSRATSSAATLS